MPQDELDDLLQEHGDDNGKAAFELWKAAIAAGPDIITLAFGV